MRIESSLFARETIRSQDTSIFFKGLSPRLDVIPIPSEDGKTDPIKLKKWAIDNLIDDSKEDFDYCQGDTGLVCR